MFRHPIRFLVLGLFLTFAGFTSVKPCLASPSSSDTQAVTTAVVNALSFPGMPSDANPRVNDLAIVGNYAIAGWLMGDGGGEDVLQRSSNGQWKVLTSGGGSMETPDVIQAGVPASIASQLIQQLQAQWK